MNNSERENRLSILEEIIQNSADAVEQEFTRTANTWFECLGSRVFAIETLLNATKTKEYFSEDKFTETLEKLERLKEELASAKMEYPDKDTPIPDSVKEQFLRDLDILK